MIIGTTTKTNRLLIIIIELIFLKWSEGYFNSETWWEQLMELRTRFDRELDMS